MTVGGTLTSNYPVECWQKGRVPNSRGNLLTIKICIVTLVFVRSSSNLVKIYFVHICNVYVYLFFVIFFLLILLLPDFPTE